MDPCQTHRGEVTCLRPPAIKRGDGIQFEALDSETTPSSDTDPLFYKGGNRSCERVILRLWQKLN